MSKVFLTMAMSLDGFITGPHDDAQNPAGVNGMRLMDWLDGVDKGGNTPDDYRPSDPNNQIVFDEAMASGAVISDDGPGTSPATGVATTTTACRSSSQPTNHLRRTHSSGSTTSPTESRRACSRPKQRPATAT